MDKLKELEMTMSMVILNEEIDSIFSIHSVSELINYEFRNPYLMAKIWDRISQDKYNAQTIQGCIYCYLTKVPFHIYPSGATLAEIKKFWNLPNLIQERLLELLGINKTALDKKNWTHESEVKFIRSEVEKYPECKLCTEILKDTESWISEYEAKAAKLKKIAESEAQLKDHMISFGVASQDTIVKSLLILNGYKDSIYQAKKLDYLLWLATGLRLTDIILTIHKFVKVKDIVICSIKPQYQVGDVEYDYEKFGLKVTKIYNHYLNECKRLGAEAGRMEKMYPGYSLSTLKTNAKAKSTQKVSVKTSEYEILKFVDEHIASEFEYKDVQEFLPWLNRVGISPMPLDSGDNYGGFIVDNTDISRISKILLQYPNTELLELRKAVYGVIDDSVNVSILSKAELLEFDNDLACGMIQSLLEWDTITFKQLMSDMKWLAVIGHSGITIRKVEKEKYRIFFNTVNFAHVTQLIWKSEYGYPTAVKLLERMSKHNKFYREVRNNFNEAIWNLHKCTAQLSLEM